MANHQKMDSPTEKGTETDLPTMYHQRHPLLGANRLPMAKSAAQFSQVEDRLQRILALAKRWHLAEDTRCLVPLGAENQG
jgi:hypothetical protein